MANKSKHAWGKRENIDAAIAKKVVDEYDVLFLDNGEIGWLDGEGNLVFNTPRTQVEHSLSGEFLGFTISEKSIPANTSLDELAKLVAQGAIPATLIKPIFSSWQDAINYVGTSLAHEGQTIKVKLEDEKYHEYIIQPGESGLVLEDAASSSNNYVEITAEEIDALFQK